MYRIVKLPDIQKCDTGYPYLEQGFQKKKQGKNSDNFFNFVTWKENEGKMNRTSSAEKNKNSALMTQTFNIKFQSDICILPDTNDIRLRSNSKKYRIMSDTWYFTDIRCIPNLNNFWLHLLLKLLPKNMGMFGFVYMSLVYVDKYLIPLYLNFFRVSR